MASIKWVPVVNQIFTADGFRAYAKSLNVGKSAWKPSAVVLHNTAEPDLAQWRGTSWQKHVDGLVSYYRDVQKWHAGPHLFCAPEGIIAFTPIVTPGIHAPGWNSTCLGVEMVGDYSRDDFNSGDGLKVHQLAVSAVATLDEVFNLDSASLRLHKEDPATTHKGCPGVHVVKASFIQEVHDELVHRKGK